MTIKKEKLLSVADISEQAEISRQRVLQIIDAGDLKAEIVGRNYIIRQSDFDVWNSSRRDAGRPPKIENGNRENGKKKSFKTIFDLAPELAGKHNNLPSDLSTNKKHLEGLGRD